MALIFFPNSEDLESLVSIHDRLSALLHGAEVYKAEVTADGKVGRRTTPREITVSYNWNEIARLLHDIRDLSESTQAFKLTKAEYLNKLAEIYEVLRSAKMPKLEAIRIALVNESNQLRQGTT